VQIQYLGFEIRPRGREYSYRVLHAGSEIREFSLTILNQAFAGNRIPYQAAADLCYQMLQRALVSETADRPWPQRTTVSEQEIEEYQNKHRPAKRRS